MRLLLIRHAQSVNNSLPEEQRSADPGITELGYRQAEKLGERLANWEPTRLLSSAFLRTLETTSQVAQATGLRPEILVELHEQGGCQAGASPEIYEGQPGMTRDEILAEFGDWQLPAAIDETGWWKCRSWEPPVQAEERARQLAESWFETLGGSGQRVAVVTHGMFLPVFVSAFLHRPFVGSEWLGNPFNTSIAQMTLSSGRATLDSYNDTAHLPPEMLSD